MDETIETKRIAPEIALIAILLLVAGIGGIVDGAVSIWQMLTVLPNPNASALGSLFQPREIARSSVFLWEILRLPLVAACVVCGVGLLRRVPWARQSMIVVLIGLIVLNVSHGVIASIQIVTAFQYGITNETTRLLTSIFYQTFWRAIYDLVLLLFLIPSSVSPQTISDEEVNTPVTLSLVADKIRSYLPATVPPVIVIIALLLIFQHIPSLFSIKILLRIIPELITEQGRTIMLLQALGISVALVTLIAGVGLLFRARWSRPAVVCMLIVSIIMPIIYTFLYPVFWSIEITRDTLIYLISGSIITLSFIAGYVVMIVYLFRYWPSPAEPEMAAEVG